MSSTLIRLEGGQETTSSRKMLFEPTRLRLARQLRKMKMKELAEHLGVSAQYVTFLEQGERIAPAVKVNEIAQILNFPVAFFYSSGIDLIDRNVPTFRSRRAMTETIRLSAIARSTVATQIVSDFFNRRFNLPSLDLLDLSGEDPENAARLLREHWGIGTEPLENMVQFLESKGIEVFWLQEPSESLDAFAFWYGNKPFIFLNSTKEAGERGRADIAHELGHLVLHRLVPLEDLDSREIENEANRFAGAFLLPSPLFVPICPAQPIPDMFFESKKLTGTSIQLQIRRAYDLGIFSDWQYQYANREVARLGWKKKEPLQIPRESSYIHGILLQKLKGKGHVVESIAEDMLIPVQDFVELVPAAKKMFTNKPSEPSQDKIELRKQLRLL